MWVYILRRILYTIPIVFGVLMVTFLLFNLIPGDPSRTIAGKNASQESIDQIRKQLGIDKPLFLNFAAVEDRGAAGAFDSQFFAHLKRAATFDFGTSIQSQQNISDMIRRGAVPSMMLMGPIFVLTLLISMPIAIFAAFKRGTRWDISLVVLAVLGMSVPSLAIIMFGQLLAYQINESTGRNILEVYGWTEGWGAIPYLILPVIIGVTYSIGADVRFFRTVMLDELRHDYVRTAYAKGVGTMRVLFVHVLKNAMVPVITKVVLAIPFLFLGSLLLERFYGIPGLGSITLDAINQRDYPVISAMTFIIALLFVLGNLATDICYALVDPRIKLQ